MTKREARKIIKQLVVAINDKDNKYSKCLWYIVTALRGPDNGNAKLKSITTAQIRGAIGLIDGYFDVNKFTAEAPNDAQYSPHFFNHYRQCVQALQRLGFIE